jgi:exopolysaccharide/PEP-CTERM locus tyrosine autokinase
MKSIERAAELLKQPTVKTSRPKVVEPFPLVDGKTANDRSSFAGDGPAQYRLEFKELSKAGYLTPDTMRGQLAEEYRHLKRPVLMTANGQMDSAVENGNLIAITSPLRGQGKTFTALNLAMSITLERDVNVLLVDGDLIGRGLTHLLKLSQRPGLTDLLLQTRIDLRDVIINTDIPNFRVLPAGQAFRDVTELLASKRMRDFTGEMSARYQDRIVLFDAPPLLATSQTIVLTALAGQVLVVVEEGKTPRQLIQRAVSLLDENQKVGMILNNCIQSSNQKYYGKYSGLS